MQACSSLPTKPFCFGSSPLVQQKIGVVHLVKDKVRYLFIHFLVIIKLSPALFDYVPLMTHDT